MSSTNFAGLSQVRQGFAAWRHQARMHHELLSLGDRHLQDIGLRRRTGDYRPLVPLGLM
jgi:uncharacterized protein YjiS (DUF1127 family)